MTTDKAPGREQVEAAKKFGPCDNCGYPRTAHDWGLPGRHCNNYAPPKLPAPAEEETAAERVHEEAVHRYKAKSAAEDKPLCAGGHCPGTGQCMLCAKPEVVEEKAAPSGEESEGKDTCRFCRRTEKTCDCEEGFVFEEWWAGFRQKFPPTTDFLRMVSNRLIAEAAWNAAKGQR